MHGAFHACIGVAHRPGRRLRFTHAGEEKFGHEAFISGAIGHGPMPQIVVDNGHRASRTGERDFGLQIGCGDLVLVVGAGDDTGGAEFEGHVLRIVKRHGPAGAMMAPRPAVLVHALPRAAGRVEVAVAVRMHIAAADRFAA